MSDINLEADLLQPSGFRWDEVSPTSTPKVITSSVPPLGALANFTGTFKGNGFNTIFRPLSTKSPTTPALPNQPPQPPQDNILELNLTTETLSFSPSLGRVPNRAFAQGTPPSPDQGDIFLNGVPYLQTISDVTVPSQPVGIHLEPGLWMAVPATNHPDEGETVVRMASIPHGTTIAAQGTATPSTPGKPAIPAVDITPVFIGTTTKVPFPSQIAASNNTERIPQTLPATITQAMLTDPNSVIRDHIAAQNVTSHITVSISTDPSGPLFGGGTANIAFLLGDAAASAPNADCVKMTATFWIETVEFEIEVPVFHLGQPALTIPGETGGAGQPIPKFLVDPPVNITVPRKITVSCTQIQYSQEVILNFNGLSWPHVSVATLVPSQPVKVPASAF